MFWKNKGILGINARNLLYIRPYNKKKAIKLADDKIKTKQFLATREIPVPKLYGVIKNPSELSKFDFNSLQTPFVLKPNHGYGGEGIIPILEKKNNTYITAGGKKISQRELEEHIHDILDGRFSISNVGDTAFFEQFIVSDDIVGKYSYGGLPDIRVVVHNLIPVMAMLRLPTKESDGKANLHMGAVGVGIDIAKGECTHIVQKNDIIDEIPDGKGRIRGLKIPFWDDILLIASKVQLITNLGYMAIDLCIDKNSGPVLLEINARAGLAVQIANLAPLRRRLERIQGVKVSNPTKGVRIAKDMFGNIVEKEIEHLSGKQVIHDEEEVSIIQKNGIAKLIAQVDTTSPRSAIDKKIAKKIGLINNSDDHDKEKNTVKVKLSIKEQRIQTVLDLVDLEDAPHKMVLGTRDLKGFLIELKGSPKETQNIKKKKKKTKNPIKRSTNFRDVDQRLIKLDNKIKLLYHLKPTNLEEERQKFLETPNFNPLFEYPELKFDPLELTDELEQVKIFGNSPTDKLFRAKRQEISNKIQLIESIDQEEFSQISTTLYGRPSKEEVEHCKKLIKELDISQLKKDPGPTFSAEETQEKFMEVFKSYGLHNWKAKIKESMVANCIAGKNNSLFIRKGARFSKEHIESLIVHEIETHIITAENGKSQPYEILNRGSANYLETQEGMAMYNVERQRKTPFFTNYSAMAHVIAIDSSLRTGFLETYNTLIELGLPKMTSFKSTLKTKRGIADTSKPGAFTKDLVYFQGYHKVAKFIESGGLLSDLYIGKMDLDDLENIKAIPNIQAPKILPKWLKEST